MMVRAKHILCAVLIAAACVSCEKNSPDAADSAIRFALAKSKEAVDDVAQMETDGSTFILNGSFSSGSSYNAAGSEQLFTNTEVSYTVGNWVYQDTKYWAKRRTYAFRALWPKTSQVTDFSDDLTDISLTYTVPAKIEDQVDLLLSNLSDGTPQKGYVSSGEETALPPVNLEFGHLLSRINVKIKKVTAEAGETPDPDDYEITSVQLSGMKNKGTYTNGTWAVSGSLMSCLNTLNTTLEDTGDPAQATLGFGASGLMLIPQSWSTGDVHLVLNYKIIHEGKTKTKSVTVSLPSTPAWEAGKYYNYVLTLSEVYDITFSAPGVDSWGAPISSGTIIIQ